MNRINVPLIDAKILNKRNRNLDSYYVNENTSPDNNKFSETPHNTSADDTDPIFTIAFASPDRKSSNIDTIYEKIMIQRFKDNILQNLRENIIEIFDTELVNFKAQCEDLVKK